MYPKHAESVGGSGGGSIARSIAMPKSNVAGASGNQRLPSGVKRAIDEYGRHDNKSLSQLKGEADKAKAVYTKSISNQIEATRSGDPKDIRSTRLLALADQYDFRSAVIKYQSALKDNKNTLNEYAKVSKFNGVGGYPSSRDESSLRRSVNKMDKDLKQSIKDHGDILNG